MADCRTILFDRKTMLHLRHWSGGMARSFGAFAAAFFAAILMLRTHFRPLSSSWFAKRQQSSERNW